MYTAYVVLVYCEHGGVDLTGLKPSPQDPSSFSAVTLLVGSFDLYKLVPDMTHIMFDGTLNLVLLAQLTCDILCTAGFVNDVAALPRLVRYLMAVFCFCCCCLLGSMV